MRHGKKFNHLGRTAPHRKAMLANMASSLVKHKRINTTIAKAKALRTFIEPLITKAKSDTTHSRRTVFKYLKDKYAVTELFRDIAPKIADRDGGYTRILKTGNRLGDNADMCFIELVDFNEVRISDGKSNTTETKKRTRRGRARKQADTKDQAISKKEDNLVEDAKIVDETSVEDKETSSKEASAEDSNKKSETKDDK